MPAGWRARSICISIANWRAPSTMNAERTLAQAAHAWGAQGIPFNDEPKSELFRTTSMERATTLLNQSAALRSLMLLSGENGVGKSALAGRWLRSLGLNLPEQPAFALILVGDPYLLATLRLRSHRALYSRIAAHARIEGLSPSEVEPYLEHQLRQVGIERPCFEPAAVELLASASEGIPRTINLVARAAWIQAACSLDIWRRLLTASDRLR